MTRRPLWHWDHFNCLMFYRREHFMCSSSVLQLSNKSQVCSKYLRRWYLDLGPISLLTEVWALLMFNGGDSKEDKGVRAICDMAFVLLTTVWRYQLRDFSTYTLYTRVEADLPGCEPLFSRRNMTGKWPFPVWWFCLYYWEHFNRYLRWTGTLKLSAKP